MLSKAMQKVKYWLQEYQPDIYIALIIVLVGVSSFGLGRLSSVWSDKEPIRIEEPNMPPDNNNMAATNNNRVISQINSLNNKGADSQKKYVASKSGSAYHYPWCPGAAKIKEENKIWFFTKEEAESKGYKPAQNCEGL